MLDLLLELLEQPLIQAALALTISLAVAFLIRRLMIRGLARLAGQTETDLDDIIIGAIERPLFYSIILGGAAYALTLLETRERVENLSLAGLQTVALIVWTSALLRIGAAILRTMSAHASTNSVVQPRTLPIFNILLKVIIGGIAIYIGMLAWKIDITAWLASAGIVGIAVGFAAKDSLANFFAGIFIIADAPYKLGDFIQFEDGLRGRVTYIGIRSTRLLTLDDIEINIPNSIIGNAKVVNETGGPYARERIKIPVDVAYGSDVDLVREVLQPTAKGLPRVCDDPEPRVLFKAFGASGLEFLVLCWIEDPAFREVVISEVNFRIYKALAAAKIEIPYSKHDIYIKSFPGILPTPEAPVSKGIENAENAENALGPAASPVVGPGEGATAADDRTSTGNDGQASPIGPEDATGTDGTPPQPAAGALADLFRRPRWRRDR